MKLESVDANLVFQIVAEVLRQLPEKSTPTASGSSQSSSSEQRFMQKVITQADIEQLPAVVQIICLPRGCVVTPAARDVIRERALTVTYQVSGFVNPHPLVLGYLSESRLSDQVRQGLVPQAEVLTGDCVIRMTRRLITKVQQQHLAVFLTREVMPVLCLANRNAEVRAVTATSVQELDHLLSSCAPNFLVVSDEGWSGFALQQLVTRFAERATWECSTTWGRVLAQLPTKEQR